MDNDDAEHHFNIIDDTSDHNNNIELDASRGTSQEDELEYIRALVLGCYCCSRRTNCLLSNTPLDVAINIVSECRTRILGLTKKQRRDFNRELVRECVVRKNVSGVLSMKYVIGSPEVAIRVCEKAFYTVWGISWHMMKTLREEIKGDIAVSSKEITEKTVSRMELGMGNVVPVSGARLTSKLQRDKPMDIRTLVLSCYCCSRRTNCLLAATPVDDAINIVTECRTRIVGMTKKQRRDFNRELVRECVVRKNVSGVLSMKYVIGSPDVAIRVCEKAFYTVWGISWHMMKTLREEIKGDIAVSSREITERTVVDSATLASIQSAAEGLMGLSMGIIAPAPCQFDLTLLPSVTTEDSVRRLDHLKPAPPHENAESRVDATVRPRDHENCVKDDMVKKRSRHSKITRNVGSVIFIPARFWDVYEGNKKWPFAIPIDKTFIRGELLSWNEDTDQYTIAFNAVGEVGMQCANSFFKTHEACDYIPVGGYELTKGLVDERAANKAPLHLKVGDIRYFCGGIWSRHYKRLFGGRCPYPGIASINDIYFEGRFVKMTGKQYEFDFDAFGLDIEGENCFTKERMTNQALVTAVIPSEGTLITREDYNRYEFAGDEDE